MAWSEIVRETRLQRISGPVGRCAAGISACMLGITVAAMAVAAQQNIFEKPSSGRFKAAPKPPETEADAEAAAAASDMIFGISANTIFFVAVGVIALLWFTIGGGRKPKVTGQQS